MHIKEENMEDMSVVAKRIKAEVKIEDVVYPVSFMTILQSTLPPAKLGSAHIVMCPVAQ